jgi:hypothetical protein
VILDELKGTGRGVTEALSQNLTEIIEEKNEKTVSILDDPVEIRSSHFPNTSVDIYRCTSSFYQIMKCRILSEN